MTTKLNGAASAAQRRLANATDQTEDERAAERDDDARTRLDAAGGRYETLADAAHRLGLDAEKTRIAFRDGRIGIERRRPDGTLALHVPALVGRELAA